MTSCAVPFLDPTHSRTRRRVMDELRRLLPEASSWPTASRTIQFGLAALDNHLPAGGLPFGALHEVVPMAEGDVPAALGFVVALLGRMRGSLLFVSACGLATCLYGHGFNNLGLDPARALLVETANAQQTFWAIEEGLRSAALTAVVGKVEALDLKTSQRLQFAARETGVPLMLLRPPRTLEASAAVTRWRVGAAEAARDRFGFIARWRWRLQLERCRNGRSGEWLVEFDHVAHCFSLAAAMVDRAVSDSPGAQSCARAG
jgi:protein ImuA